MQPALPFVHRGPTRTPLALRRRARWALLAWAWVLLASLLSPWAQAGNTAAGPHLERLCTALGEPIWVTSPVGAPTVWASPRAWAPPWTGDGLLADNAESAERGGVAGLHGLDCALCLPQLAPPLATVVVALPVGWGLAPRVWPTDSLRAIPPMALPQARAPPAVYPA